MWWHTVTQAGEVKGKLANVVGSQYPSRYLGTWCIQHYYRWCAHLGCQKSTELTSPRADLNGLVRFARKTKSGFCACAITFQLASTKILLELAQTGLDSTVLVWTHPKAEHDHLSGGVLQSLLSRSWRRSTSSGSSLANIAKSEF